MRLTSISPVARGAFIATLAASALAMTAFADDSVAQQKMTKDQLVGSWAILSCANPNGGKPRICVEPHGGMIFDAGGRYAVVFRGGVYPNFTANVSRAQRSPEDYKAAAQGLVAQTGTWSFDETGQRFTFHIETALFGQENDSTYSVSRSGDELRVVEVIGNAANGNVYLFRRAP